MPATTPTPTTDKSLSSKGERTREAILDAALELFSVEGYDKTTMRMIAARARVSLGNSYYYFPSKEHLVQAFYRRLQERLVEACRPRLENVRDLHERLRIVTRTRLEIVAPYHEVSGALFHSAADPRSPLSPFSAESAPIRNDSIEFWREVVQGSNAKLPKDVAPAMPYMLWLYDVGLVLFWIHDNSASQARSHEFAEDTTDVIVRLLSIAQLPVARVIRRKMLHWVARLASGELLEKDS